MSNEKKGLFSKLFSKKPKSTEETGTTATPTVDNPARNRSATPTPEVKHRYSLYAFGYVPTNYQFLSRTHLNSTC